MEFWKAALVIFAMMLIVWLIGRLFFFITALYAVVAFYFTSFQNTLYWSKIKSRPAQERQAAVLSHIRSHFGDYCYLIYKSATKSERVLEVYVADVLAEGEVWPPPPQK